MGEKVWYAATYEPMLVAGRWRMAVHHLGRSMTVGACDSPACAGHDTQDEARRHWFIGLVLTAGQRTKWQHATWCKLCGEQTAFTASLNPPPFVRTYSIPLCPQHSMALLLEEVLRTEGLDMRALSRLPAANAAPQDPHTLRLAESGHSQYDAPVTGRGKD